jgi:hypothetical protein
MRPSSAVPGAEQVSILAASRIARTANATAQRIERACVPSYASDKKMTDNWAGLECARVGTRIARGPNMVFQFPDPEAAKASSDAASSARPYAYASRDPRALRIIAKTIYREMRAGGLVEEDLMSVASELLSLVAGDMKDRRAAGEKTSTPEATRR